MKKIFEFTYNHWLNLKKLYLACAKGNINNDNYKCNSKYEIKFINLIVFLKKHSIEISIFFLTFIVAFSQLTFGTSFDSNGNVEQWTNLTNQMFYGKQDFLFSYGPLYWLTGGATSPYNVCAYWLTIAFVGVSNAIFWSIIFKLSYKAHALVFFAIAFFLFFNRLIFPASYFLWPFAVVAYIEFNEIKPLPLRKVILLTLGILVGLFFYIRFMYGTIALAVFGTYFLSRLLKERKISPLLLFITGTIITYIAIGFLVFHNRISIANYLNINSQLSFGNSIDMTLDVVNTRCGFIAVALTSIFLNIYLIIRKRYLLLTVNVLLLLLFKLGFSRTDHYIDYFVIPTAAVALVMLFDKSKLGRLLFVLVMGSLYYLSTVPVFPGARTEYSSNLPVDFKIAYPSRMQSVYPSFKLNDTVLKKIGKSTIDIYPYNNEYAFANNLNYQHRPLFQNYMTLSPALDLMNQRFFDSTDRPKFILWTSELNCEDASCNPFDAPDQKFSLNEDPRTTTTILMNYHVVKKFDGKNALPAALLEENHDTTIYSDSLISTQTMKFGEWYKVPQSSRGVIKLIPNLKFTMLGRLKNMLFRGNVLKIKYKMITGEIKEYRVNILNSESGIWVSPLLDNFEMNGLRVHSIMLVTSSSNYFKTMFQSKWVNVPIPNINARRPLFDPELKAQGYFPNKLQIKCDGNIDAVDGVSPASSKIEAAVALRVSGWLALSAKDGIIADKTFLTLTNEQGMKFYFATHTQSRPDVAAALNQIDLSESGYDSLIDLSTLKGDYILGLAGTHDSKFFTCSNFSVPLTITSSTPTTK